MIGGCQAQEAWRGKKGVESFSSSGSTDPGSWRDQCVSGSHRFGLAWLEVVPAQVTKGREGDFRGGHQEI